MPSLAYFTSPILIQALSQSYGSSDPNKFNVSSPFTYAGEENVYAVLKGTILLQQQTDVNKVNLILRPHDQKEIKLPIKYIIYRGLKTSEFLESTNISDPANKVKTSGSELLSEMQTIQTQRAPGTAIPVEALFGNELAPATTKNIDEFFFKNLAPSSQLFTVDCGIAMGKFAGEVSIEIVLENPEFFVTVELAKRAKYEIDVTSISDPAQKRWTQDLARHFVDPAAFYGFHHDINGGIEYRNSSNKLVANTPILVYENIVNKFSTKNKVYLDVRNENGYSYNYYNNYKGTGTDANKNIKIGQSIASMNNKEYYTNGWPVHVINIIPGTTAENDVFLALRINDNEKPLLAGWNTSLTPNTVIDPPLNNTIAKRVYFVDETSLLPTSASEFTNTVSFKVPNVLGSTAEQMATIVRLDYIKQLRINDGADAFPQQNSTDYLFGPVNVSIPWDSQDGVQWIGSDHYKYFDGLNQGFVSGTMEETINSLDISLKTITINKKIDAQITNKVKIVNTTNTQNVGEYSVIKVENPTSTSTKITILESFPSSLQTGDKLSFTIEAAVTFDYNKKKVIAKSIDLSNVSAFGAGKKVKLMVKKSVETIQTVVSSLLVNGNTEITLNTFDKQGFGSIMLTGMAAETNLSTGPNPPDNDNILFYAVPQYYFKNTGGKNNNAFNFKGATSKNESFIKTMQKFSSDFQIEKYSLQPTTGNFVATLAYNTAGKAQENILILGLKKSEFEDLKTAAAAQLSPYHIQTLKLKPQGNRLRDQDYEAYYKYNVVIAGLNNAGNYTETMSYKEVYSRDGLIFTSPEYASNTVIELGSKLNEEELFHLNSVMDSPPGEWNKKQNGSNANSTFNYLFETLGSTLKTIVDQFKTDLDTLTTSNFKLQIENKIKQRGKELLDTARSQIRTTTSGMYNKDGALYLARLKMRKIIKQHPLILSSFISYNEVEKYLDLLEKISRGLHDSNLPDFSTHPGHIPILISGYDPFRAAFPGGNSGLDNDSYLSNPSGNIALALNDEVIINGNKKAIIKSAIFPVRFKEFNEGWIEDFFGQYIDPNHSKYKPVKMIITFSYGGADHFNIDGFSSRFREPENPDNNKKNGGMSGYLLQSDKDNYEFISTTLPFQSFKNANPGKMALHQKAVVNYYKNGNFLSREELFDNLNLNSLVPFPNITNYPFSTADKLKAVEGTGGDYLSNEIYYRVAFLRTKYDPSLKTGHIHVGFNKNDVSRNERDQMAIILKDVLKQVITNL